MCLPANEWRGFKKLKPEAHEERKSQSELPAKSDEWREIWRLPPVEKSSQGQQQPRKPKVRDPCKGQMVSADEGEVCEWLQPEDDEETNGQSEMCPPANEWRGFKMSKPKAHKQRESWRERSAPTDEGDDGWRPRPEEYEEKFSGRRASQANAVSHPPKVKERREPLGGKDLQFSPGKEQILPESYFRRIRHFLQCVSPHKKVKGKETVLQKASLYQLLLHARKQSKGDPGLSKLN